MADITLIRLKRLREWYTWYSKMCISTHILSLRGFLYIIKLAWNVTYIHFFSVCTHRLYIWPQLSLTQIGKKEQSEKTDTEPPDLNKGEV